MSILKRDSKFRRLVQSVTIVSAAVTGALASVPAFAASGGYGSGTPAVATGSGYGPGGAIPLGVPGGFSVVVAVRSFAKGGDVVTTPNQTRTSTSIGPTSRLATTGSTTTSLLSSSADPTTALASGVTGVLVPATEHAVSRTSPGFSITSGTWELRRAYPCTRVTSGYSFQLLLVNGQHAPIPTVRETGSSERTYRGNPSQARSTSKSRKTPTAHRR